MKKLLLCLGLFATPAFAELPKLTIYTYDAFIPDYGPGPKIEDGFEKICDCDLEFQPVGSGSALVTRLKLEGAETQADIILGIDNNTMGEALESGFIAKHGLEKSFSLPVEWNDPYFVPFDYGYLAFIYDNTKLETPPSSFKELADSDLKIIIQDPRTSSPGMAVIAWVKEAYSDGAKELWGALSDNILTVTKGWSEAYGMFLEGEGDMVLSYTTSPAYHVIVENDLTKSAAKFEEGHYLQVEVAAIVESSDQKALAQRFLDYLTSAEAQSLLPTTNWAYPVIDGIELPSEFSDLVLPEKGLLADMTTITGEKESWVEEWRSALSQ